MEMRGNWDWFRGYGMVLAVLVNNFGMKQFYE